MDNCKHCSKPLAHVPGRKKKDFCNVNCKNKYFYAQRSALIKKAQEFEVAEKSYTVVNPGTSDKKSDSQHEFKNEVERMFWEEKQKQQNKK